MDLNVLIVSLEILGSVLAIVIAGLAGIRNIKQDFNAKVTGIKTDMLSIKADMKTDMARFETRMEKIDDRWVTLFERFHILNKT